jgi:hypothetical protein
MEGTTMKKLILALTLLCFGVFCANATVTTPVAGVVHCTATADVISTQLPYSAKITGIKVNSFTGGKYYRLRVGTVSGAIVYEANSAATTASLTLDRVEFHKPSAGLYFQTDDSSGAITVYTDN